MTETSTQALDAAKTPNMQVLAQFIRDFSFENPRAPQSLRMEAQPEVDLGVEMSARGRTDGLFEVDLKINIKAKNPDGPMFAIELLYGGVFQVSNIPEEAIEQVLLVDCPRYMFPYVRRIVSDATADGGFLPPFFMEPIDFMSLYLSQKDTANQKLDA